MRRDDQAEPEEPEEDLEYEDDGAIRLEDGGLVTDEADDFSEEAEGEADAPVELAGPADEVAPKPPEPLADRARALWADILTQARKIELPGAPEAGRQRILTVAAIVLASLVAGVGAYLLANSTGTDVEQARLEGQVAGRAAGAIEGASQGYSAGFQKGRLRGFRKAYVPAYRIYYKRAFEQAGLDPPSNEQFDVPVP
jgi:flagellar biosynthesis/type III secretory pathway protein FliH